MKTIILALCLVAVPLTFTGCKSPTSERVVAYKTLRTVADAVDTAMNAYADAVVQDQVPIPVQHRVRDLHMTYRHYLGSALEVAQYNYAAPVPAELAGVAAHLTALITQTINKR